MNCGGGGRGGVDLLVVVVVVLLLLLLLLLVKILLAMGTGGAWGSGVCFCCCLLWPCIILCFCNGGGKGGEMEDQDTQRFCFLPRRFLIHPRPSVVPTLLPFPFQRPPSLPFFKLTCACVPVLRAARRHGGWGISIRRGGIPTVQSPVVLTHPRPRTEDDARACVQGVWVRGW